MILAVDVHYDPQNTWARTGGLVFRDWAASEAVAEFVTTLDDVSPYESGAFYKRELPCILPVVQHVLSRFSIETIVVDGFVDLAQGAPGLGQHLHTRLEREIEVIGVAKNEFEGAPATAITRGISRNPLWISSTVDHAAAAARVASMVGQARIPLLLKRTDALARGTVSPIDEAPEPGGNCGNSKD